MAFSSTLGKKELNLETVNATNVILRNNVVKSDGRLSDYLKPEAQFFVDEGTDGTNQNLLYRFRPVSQPKKYLAVVGSSVVLKDIPNTTTLTDSSHDFYLVSQDNNYDKYLYRNSPTNMPLYMSTNNNDDVVLARDSEKAWFALRAVDVTSTTSSTTTTASAPEFFVKIEDVFEEISSQGMHSIVEIKETSVSGKIILGEKMSVSEE